MFCINQAITFTASGATTYTWSGGQQTSVISFTPFSSGIYSVTGTNSTTSCSSSKSVSVTVSNCIGLKYSEENIFRIYPNPVHDDLTIAGTVTGTLLIYDLTGKLVFNEIIHTGENILNLKNILPGFYILKIKSSSGIYTSRFLRQN